MGARRRLERLEATLGGTKPYETPPYILLHLKQMDNARREMEGLEPVPLSPEEELERESKRDALENLIPTMRADPGWQGEEARAFLDEWERDARERVRGDR